MPHQSTRCSFQNASEHDFINVATQNATFAVPNDAKPRDTIHIVCEVADNGTLPLTCYQRIAATALLSGFTTTDGDKQVSLTEPNSACD